MQPKELVPDIGFRPSSPHELVDVALSCADQAADHSPSNSSSVDLDQLSNEAWAQSLLSVAWVLYRRMKHNYDFREEDLIVLAKYLGHFRKDAGFLQMAASLIQKTEDGWWCSPRLPDLGSRQETITALRKQ